MATTTLTSGDTIVQQRVTMDGYNLFGDSTALPNLVLWGSFVGNANMLNPGHNNVDATIASYGNSGLLAGIKVGDPSGQQPDGSQLIVNIAKNSTFTLWGRSYVDHGATMTVNGQPTGSMVLNGRIDVAGGKLDVLGDLSGGGHIVMSDPGTDGTFVELSGVVSDQTKITINSGMLQVDHPELMHGEVEHLGADTFGPGVFLHGLGEVASAKLTASDLSLYGSDGTMVDHIRLSGLATDHLAVVNNSGGVLLTSEIPSGGPLPSGDHGFFVHLS